MSTGLTFAEADTVIQTLKEWNADRPDHAAECDGSCSGLINYLSSGQWTGYPYAAEMLYEQHEDIEWPNTRRPGITAQRALDYESVGGDPRAFADLGPLSAEESAYIKEFHGLDL